MRSLTSSFSISNSPRCCFLDGDSAYKVGTSSGDDGRGFRILDVGAE